MTNVENLEDEVPLEVSIENMRMLLNAARTFIEVMLIHTKVDPEEIAVTLTIKDPESGDVQATYDYSVGDLLADCDLIGVSSSEPSFTDGSSGNEISMGFEDFPLDPEAD